MLDDRRRIRNDIIAALGIVVKVGMGGVDLEGGERLTRD